MNKKIKISIILINLILIFFLISNVVYAGDLIGQFKDSIDIDGSDDLKDAGGTILGIIRVVGTIISVAMLMLLGIKYMLGSADQKAEYRKTMFPYFVGAVLLFAATNITDAIYSWVKEL